MFRGLTRREHAIGVGLLLLLAAGAGLRQWMDQPRFETAVIGNAIDHPAGQLRLDVDPQPRLSESLIDGKIDLNVASAALLEELPGIGPVKAASIVQWREENGPFARVEDLTRVPGIGEKTLERLRSSVTVHANEPVATAPSAPGSVLGMSVNPWQISPDAGIAAAVPPRPAPPVDPASAPVRINVATETELQLLNGIGPALARRIVEDRSRRGPFRSADDLQRVSGIGPITVDKNRHRIVVQ